MVSRIDGSANICSVATSSISRSLLKRSGASRSTVQMPGKSTNQHAARSITSSTDAAAATGEGSGTIDITTSRSPAGGGSAESSSEGTITTFALPEPTPVSGSNAAWEAVASAAVRPSSTAATVTGGGGAPDFFTAEARAGLF
jgi:hypothetical protein